MFFVKNWKTKGTWRNRSGRNDVTLVAVMVVAVFVFVVDGNPRMRVVRGERPPSDGAVMSDMVTYLSDYGYVETAASGGAAQLQTADELSEAIRLVQRVANLHQTGILDDATAEYIARPRCGVSDRGLVEKLRSDDGSAEDESVSGRSGVRSRSRRYTISGYGKWEKTILTWNLKRSTGKVHESVVLREMQRALKVWSDGSGLQFRRVASNEKADIEFDFFRRRHYDHNNFDGEGGVLAHAFYPITAYAGDLHFDDDENWMEHEDAKNAGHGKSVSLFYVAAHELGHSLGLDHSDDPDSLMMASYPGAKDIPSLPRDDLMAIQYLYGGNNGDNDGRPEVTRPPVRRTTMRTTMVTRPQTYRPEPPPTSPPRRRTRPPPQPSPPTTMAPTTMATVSEVCPMTFNTIASVRGELFLFKNQDMWRINSRDEITGPFLTSLFWRGLPEDLAEVDAVYERQTGGSNIMFFSGQRYWTFDGNVLLPGYPRPLTDLGLPADLKRVDATLVWGHNGQTYFFAGNQYWRFNETREHIDPDYPRDISAWHGVPSHLTSALRWKGGRTYFFKGKVFWQFDNERMAVEHNAGRLSLPYWIECLGRAFQDDENSVDRYDTSDRSNSLKKSALGSNGRSIYSDGHQILFVSVIFVFNLVVRTIR